MIKRVKPRSPHFRITCTEDFYLFHKEFLVLARAWALDHATPDADACPVCYSANKMSQKTIVARKVGKTRPLTV